MAEIDPLLELTAQVGSCSKPLSVPLSMPITLSAVLLVSVAVAIIGAPADSLTAPASVSLAHSIHPPVAGFIVRQSLWSPLWPSLRTLLGLLLRLMLWPSLWQSLQLCSRSLCHCCRFYASVACGRRGRPTFIAMDVAVAVAAADRPSLRQSLQLYAADAMAIAAALCVRRLRPSRSSYVNCYGRCCGRRCG